MKKALSPGRVLAVCLTALVIAVSAEPATAIAPLDMVEHPVTIRHLEGDAYVLSLSTAMVLEVKTVVDNVLGAISPTDSVVDPLHQSLSTIYGERLTAAVEIGYYLYWDGEKWVIVCEHEMTFEIDFGTRGTVVVEASDAVIG